jgi:hypothetical protein
VHSSAGTRLRRQYVVERALGKRPTTALGQPVVAVALLDEVFVHQLLDQALYPPCQRTAKVRSRKADRIRQLAQRLVGKSA